MIDPTEDEQETLLFSLVYCSRAVEQLTTAQIDAIVSKAQLKNSGLQITGWLVYGSGIFFQWLEGERGAVKRLMADITADTRHTTIVVLSESEGVEERLFEGWDMELVSAEEIGSVLTDALGESSDAKTIALLHQLLRELKPRGVMADFDER